MASRPFAWAYLGRPGPTGQGQPSGTARAYQSSDPLRSAVSATAAPVPGHLCRRGRLHLRPRGYLGPAPPGLPGAAAAGAGSRWTRRAFSSCSRCTGGGSAAAVQQVNLSR